MNTSDEKAAINRMIDEALEKFNYVCKDAKVTESRLRELFAKLKQLEKELDDA